MRYLTPRRRPRRSESNSTTSSWLQRLCRETDLTATTRVGSEGGTTWTPGLRLTGSFLIEPTAISGPAYIIQDTLQEGARACRRRDHPRVYHYARRLCQLIVPQADHRARGLSRLLESLKPAMLSGSLADRVWAHLCRATSETKGRRRKIVNSVAQAYEAGATHPDETPCEYADHCNSARPTMRQSSGIWWVADRVKRDLTKAERHLKLIEKILPMLSTEQGVHALTSGELQQDHGEREEVKILLELGDGIGRYGR